VLTLAGPRTSTRTARPARLLVPPSARRLRATAGALERLLRRPERPDGWADPELAVAIDRVRGHLRPIHTLAALAESWSREHALLLHRAPLEIRLAYAVRWLEIAGRLDERPWRLICPPER